MQRLIRTTGHRKAALVTTAVMAGGLGTVLLLPGMAMASTLPTPASTGSQSPPRGGSSAPQFEASNPPLTATAGSDYQYTFAASGHPSYSLSGAPGWLSINAATGQVSGAVPSGTNVFSYSVTASNAGGTATSGQYTVRVTSGQQQGGTGNGHQPGGYQNRSYLTTQLSCPSSVKAGQTASCTLTVTDEGGSGSARNVTASIDLASALQAKYCGQTADWHWGWNSANCSLSGNDAIAQLGTVGAGQSKTVSVYFRASDSWSWRSSDQVEVTGSAQSESGYADWNDGQAAQSTAYVTVYNRRFG